MLLVIISYDEEDVDNNGEDVDNDGEEEEGRGVGTAAAVVVAAEGSLIDKNKCWPFHKCPLRVRLR